MNPELPKDMIYSEILSRLPVKSLMRFKCVCRHWSSLTRDPIFTRAHRNFQYCRRNSHTHLLLKITSMQSKILSVKIEQEGISPIPAIHLLTLPYQPYSLGHTPNTHGLLCLYLPNSNHDSHPLPLRMFNPNTRETLTLQPLCHNANDIYLHHDHPNSNNDHHSSVCIFNPCTQESVTLSVPNSPNVTHYIGFSPLTNEHKVLQVHWILGGSTPQYSTVNGRMDFMFKILTLGTNATAWRHIEVDFPFDPRNFQFHNESVCLHGAIHWVCRSQNMIVAFDVGEERFRTMRLPEDYGTSAILNGVVTGCVIIDVGGCVAVFDYDQYWMPQEQHYIMRLWILKDYKNQVWVKKTICFPFDCTSNLIELPVPLGTIHTGELLLHSQLPDPSHVWVHLYDLKTQSFRRSEIVLPEGMSPSDVRVKLLTTYDESLVPL